MSPVDRPAETPEDRKARQFASLRTLGECALDLATDAHAGAKRQLDPANDPGPATEPNPAGRVDHVAAFATLARAVRQTVAIEIRLDAPPRTRPGFRQAPLPDPRRAVLRWAFHKALAPFPERARRCREADEMIEQQLAADPEGLARIQDIVEALAVGIGVTLDVAKLPDELLGIEPRPGHRARASPWNS